jgi:subfamily B ATP-binding cassette protein MsbA
MTFEATLTKLSSGAIFWDQTDCREFALSSLRAQLAVVTQEPFLFDDTIENNIRFGRMEASEAELMEAAKIANAHEFIMTLPGGYKTKVDELGMRLSGGQRQRICIARAVLRRAPVLLLDEATSNLDAESEALVTEALNRLMSGCTTFVVAHRLSTVRGAARILVLEKGHIVEEGSHQELVAQAGVYARLLARQTGGEDEG